MYPQDYPHTPSDYRQTDKTGELGQTHYKVQYLPRFEIDNQPFIHQLGVQGLTQCVSVLMYF